MGKKVDVDDLIGAADIATRLGLPFAQNVHTLRERNDNFPAPVATIGRTHVWSWPDVEAWAKAAGRLS